MGNYASSHSTYSAVVEPIPVQTTAKAKVSMAITYSVSVVATLIKSSLVELFEDIITSYSGASAVLSEIEESWYEDMMDKIDRRCARLQEDAHESVMAVIDADVSTFLGPRDTIVQVISSHPSKHKRHVDDDCCSCTTDATEVLSDDEVIYTSDSDDFNDDESDGEEDDDVVDLETQVDQLLCLSPSCPSSSPLVYVEDYLCPCGECPQYKRIVNDVQTTMPYLSSQQQTSVIRVLQAYSTHNEVIGYLPEMLATAEECLYVWSGDENQALTSLVMLYDEIPQLLHDDYPQWVV